MTYVMLCVGFVAVALVVAVLAWRRAHRGHAWALALSAAALVVLTAIFDNVMIGAGLFGYADTQISGVRLGLAPVEDFAYPIAGVLLLPAIWVLLDRRASQIEASGQRGAPGERETSARPETSGRRETSAEPHPHADGRREHGDADD